jgi:hypothetical protein
MTDNDTIAVAVTDILATAALYFAAMLCVCVALSQLLRFVTSPFAVQFVAYLAQAVR